MILVLLFICFLVGAGLAITGIVLWGIFDIDCGETIGKIGLILMVTPICIGLFVFAIMLLLSVFGLAILF